MKSKFPLIFILIIILAAALRFYHLSDNPPGLYWDEASIAYNAYSILETGKDEFGNPHPFWFKAFGEYKLPVYIYATSLATAILGLQDLSVRFPSALAGTLSVAAIYLLAQELFKKYQQRDSISTIAALFFAISPWSIQFSRAGFEANLALFFILSGTYSMFVGLRTKNKTWLSVSSISFVLSVFTYNSARLFTPLLLLSTILIYKQQIKTALRPILVAIVVGLFIFIPFLPQQFSQASLTRAVSTTFFGKQTFWQALNQFISQYSENFDTNYLFFHGDSIGRHSTKKLGMLNYFDLPLVIIGFLALKSQKKSPRNFILAWLLLAPVPAALTQPSPHALRSLNILPAWILISSLGLQQLLSWLKKSLPSPRLLATSFLLLATIIIYNHLIFLNEYHVRYPRLTALDWADGNKEAVEVVRNRLPNYDQVFLSDNLPLIYLALYLPIQPEIYQNLPEKDVKQKISIGKITYFSQAWEIDLPTSGNWLTIAPYWQKPAEGTPHEIVRIKNEDEIYNIWEENAVGQRL